MMRERAWRATGRRTVAGTRMARLYFALFSPVFFHLYATERRVAPASMFTKITLVALLDLD